AYLIWQAFQTLVPVDAAGSGTNAYSIVFGRQRRRWSIPRGGSGALTEALTRFLEDHGGSVLCNRQVARLVIEDGRCTGVETDDGERYEAGRAVLSTIHVKHLVGMAPAELWGEEFLYGVETYDLGVPGMAGYFATSAPPLFEGPGGPRAAVSAGLAGWPEQVLELGRAVRDRRPYDGEVPWLLVATPTLVDPDRAPPGHHTVKLLSAQPWELPEGVESWEQRKQALIERQLENVRRFVPNLADAKILASYLKSPQDMEASNQHMIHGAFHGGDRGYAFSGPNRPVPGWAAHRMPIPGLYQTGGTTSVGGSVTGIPGRNAAMVMLSDLGEDPAEVMGVGGRARAGSR
ncbi:MAG: phytoene desaturase family protein, partial [Gammaproteobacteria bacterium]